MTQWFQFDCNLIKESIMSEKNCVDELLCPLCNKPNLCMAKSSEPCWCNTVQVPLALRELVPFELKMRACICQKCIEAFNANQNEFLNDLKMSSL